jgi:hypothetical protein
MPHLPGMVFEGPIHACFRERTDDGAKMEGYPVMTVAGAATPVFDLFASAGFRVDPDWSHRRIYGRFAVTATRLDGEDKTLVKDAFLCKERWPGDESQLLLTVKETDSGRMQSSVPLPRLFGFGTKTAADSDRYEYGVWRLEIEALPGEPTPRPLAEEATHEAEVDAAEAAEELAYRHEIAAKIISGEIPLEALGLEMA